MSTAIEIERAIEQLPPEEFDRLRAWFVAFEARRWDEHLARGTVPDSPDGLFGEMDRHASHAESVDDSRQSIYTRQPGE